MIDIRTFLLAYAIGNIGFAMLIAGYSRNGKSHAGMHAWKWAKLVQGGAHALAFAWTDLSWSILDLVSNGLLICGIAMEVGAYAVFLNLPRFKRALYPLCALALIAWQSLRMGGASWADLTALMSLLVAMFTAMMAYLLLRDWRTCSSLQKLIGLNDVVFFCVMAARAVVMVADPEGLLFPPRLFLVVAFITGYGLMIVNGFGFLLLCKQQDDLKMELLATVDSLTGLLNRRAFFEHTESARALAARLQKPVSLMMLDIDHFKRLNDRFGHATGDEALCVFAQTVRSVLREHDISGRLGGEEFALAMPGTDLAGALQAAERLRVAVSEAPVLTDGNTYVMTVSVGVVVVDPNEHINAALARADRALYAAKSAGRNRVESGEAIHPELRSRA
ncbi:MAG TPA: GGDEF domain-containing protein [Telluria sp.]|nr:GGDEF domain-containing protein [Telluria sp.]